MIELFNEPLKQQLIDCSDYRKQFSFDTTHHVRLFQVMAGDYIVKENRRPEYLFYLARGRAKLYVTLSNGRVSLIDFFAAPCFVGEIELVDEGHDARAVQAIEDCWCLALPIKQCRSQLLKDAAFLRNLCVTLSKKISRNIVSATQNQSFPLANRLAAFILLTQNKGLYHEKHTQAAEYLGVSYRHLLYVLAQFRQDGVLQKQRGGYLIKDKSSLAMLTQEMGLDVEFLSKNL